MSFSVKKTVEPGASKSVIMSPLSTFILQVSLSLLLLQGSAAAASSLAGNEDDEAFVEFIRFQKTFGKVYGSQEIRERFETFKQNLQNIRRHNGRSDATYTMGVTQFADLSGKMIYYLKCSPHHIISIPIFLQPKSSSAFTSMGIKGRPG